MVREIGGKGLRRRPQERRGRPVLDHSAIVDACVAIVRTEGRTALTVARVARDLEVTPRSIYHYFDSRRAMLAAVVGRTQQSLPVPTQTGDWRADLRRYRDGLFDYMEANAAALEITAAEGIYELSPTYHEVVERALGVFESIGLGPHESLLAYGEFARWVDSAHRNLRPMAADDETSLFEEVVRSGAEADAGDRPLTTAAGTVTTGEQLEFGFGLLLDSFARLADERA